MSGRHAKAQNHPPLWCRYMRPIVKSFSSSAMKSSGCVFPPITVRRRTRKL